MNREDAATAVNHLSAAAVAVERLYTAADDLGVRAELVQIRQDIKGSLDRLRRLQQAKTVPADGGAG